MCGYFYEAVLYLQQRLIIYGKGISLPSLLVDLVE